MTADARSTLREVVYELLASGRTVAQVCERTQVPRRVVMQYARELGMKFLPGRDTFVVGHVRPRPGSLTELVQRGEASHRQRTQTLAARVRSLVVELERCVEADDAARARGTYDVAHVRRWARQQGMTVPDRGRYLPAHVVDAWRMAGEP